MNYEDNFILVGSLSKQFSMYTMFHYLETKINHQAQI